MCEMCMAQAAWVERRGEWMRGLGLGFINPVGTGGVLVVCLCLGCSGEGGVVAWCCLPRPGPSSNQSRFPLSR